MTQYLLTMFHPDGPPPANIDEIMTAMGTLRAELEAQGSWVFGHGLQPSTTATVVRADGDQLLTTDGPFVEAHEHIGGVTIIDVADLDEALAWAKRYVDVLRIPMEVRPFQPMR